MATFYIRGKIGGTPDTCSCSCAQLIAAPCTSCNESDDPCNELCGTRTVTVTIVAPAGCSWTVYNLYWSPSYGCTQGSVAGSGSGNGVVTGVTFTADGPGVNPFGYGACCFDNNAIEFSPECYGPDTSPLFSIIITQTGLVGPSSDCNFSMNSNNDGCSGFGSEPGNVCINIDNEGFCSCTSGLSGYVDVFGTNITFVDPQSCTQFDAGGRDYCYYCWNVFNPKGQVVNLVYNITTSECCCDSVYGAVKTHTLPNLSTDIDIASYFMDYCSGFGGFYTDITATGTIYVRAGDPIYGPFATVYPYECSTRGVACVKVRNSAGTEIATGEVGSAWTTGVCFCDNQFNSSCATFNLPTGHKFFTIELEWQAGPQYCGDSSPACTTNKGTRTIGVAVKKCVYNSTYSGGSWGTPTVVLDTFVDSLDEEAAESINLDTYTPGWACIGTNLAEYTTYGPYMDMTATCGSVPACTLSPCP